MAIHIEKGQNIQLSLDVFHVGLGWDVREDDSSNEDFDLDVSAFMLKSDKKIPSDDWLVYYNSGIDYDSGSPNAAEKPYRLDPNDLSKLQPFDSSKYHEYTDRDGIHHTSRDAWREQTRPVSPDWSVIGSIDDEDGSTSEDGDDETMDINLGKVRADINEIVICVSIHKYAERRQNFGQVERAYVRLYKPGQAETEGEYIYDLTEDFSTCASVEFCRLYRKDGGWKIQALGIGHKGGLEELVSKFV